MAFYFQGPTIRIAVEGRKPLDLTHLKALEGAATPGPWLRDYGNHVEYSACGDEGFEEWQEAGPVMVGGDTPQSNADADFVAAARKAIPELIAEIERLAPFEIVAMTFLEKTEWVQATVQPHELGQHRADILRARIVALEEK
ncbi:hypothetical protein [Pseudomonas syringae]|uniref:hypothetical protein n=1 Tax=Pseudomonas syringae TaxID=317 RepID=UPI000730FB8D|nr:hypothetical protein [Pseudomonas syringae]KTB99843.1 hypothetical protein AO386_06160 [Pseudomonas syringae ICMP 11292]